MLAPCLLTGDELNTLRLARTIEFAFERRMNTNGLLTPK